MKRLSGFTMIEIVAVMFILTALALVAVPVGRGALTHRQEREFMERVVEEWEMLKMKARSNHVTVIFTLKALKGESSLQQ